MNKNLKKVLSAVSALAISASAVSAFAVEFPDVAEDASYHQAVKELSSLDVISGFEDGTFRPDDLVTRAQMTKMIVDALNEREMAEGSKSESKFNDVATDHWAKGYINQGVADGFIAGYSDTEFGPEDNVTYVQAQKMLISATGYETYAQGSGGWPNGYKIWASSQGITDGIYGLADDTQLTRAQVAQLIDNAMGIPVCIIRGYDTTIDGRRTPIFSIRDGEGKYYETLFTKRHRAYKVFGRVTDTNKSDSDTVKPDQVMYRVEKADNFNDEWIIARTDVVREDAADARTELMYFVDEKAPELFNTYTEALIQKDFNDEFTILSITPVAASKGKTVTLEAEDFDDAKSAASLNNELYFYPAGTTRSSKRYALGNENGIYEVYVNGKKINNVSSTLYPGQGLSDWVALVQYIKDHETSAVTLEKVTSKASVNAVGDYSLVMINTYETAIVEEVVEKNDNYTVAFDTVGEGISSSRMEIKKDDEDYSYTFKLGDEEINVTDLQPGDVLSIAFDRNVAFQDSTYYDVLVSRDTAEGKCSSISTGDTPEFKIDGTTYKAAQGISIAADKDIETAGEYVLSLDHFGRIAKVEEIDASKQLAILKNIYKKTGGDWYAQIITKDGIEEEHKVDEKNVQKYGAFLKATTETKVENGKTVIVSQSFTDGGNNGVTYGGDSSKLKLYPQQVIQYTVASSSDKITIKNDAVLDPQTLANVEYKKDGTKFGTVKLGSNTAILDISEIDSDDEFTTVSPETLVDGNFYAVNGYDKTKSGDRYFRFVLITEGTTNFTSDSQMAIFNGREKMDINGDSKDAYKLVVPTEEGPAEVTYVVAESLGSTYDDGADRLEEGDAIIYVLNGANEIKKIAPIFASNKYVDNKGWSNFQSTVLANTANLASTVIKTGADAKVWKDLLHGSSEKMDVKFGIIINKRGKNITFVNKVYTGQELNALGVTKPTNAGDVALDDSHYFVDLDDPDNTDLTTEGATLYGYNFAGSSKASKVFTDTPLKATPQYSAAKTNEATSGTIANHTFLDISDNGVYGDVVYGVARVDDDEVRELYMLYHEN